MRVFVRSATRVTCAARKYRRVARGTILATMILGPTACTRSDDWETCNKAEGEVAIAACTGAIKSGKLQGHDLEIAYVSRGLAKVKKSELGAAIEDFNEAIRLDPNYIAALINRGVAYGLMGQIDRAIEDYTRAIKLDPNSIQAYFDRGFAYSNAGDYRSAVEDYSQVILLDPKNFGAFNNRCNVQNMRRDYDSAIQDCSKAIELNPGMPNGFIGRAGAYASKKDYDRAIEDYTKAISSDPTAHGRSRRAVARNHIMEITAARLKTWTRRSSLMPQTLPRGMNAVLCVQLPANYRRHYRTATGR